MNETIITLDTVIKQIRGRDELVTVSKITSLMPPIISATSLALTYIETVFDFFAQIPQPDISLMKCAYIYGSTATGTVKGELRLVETQILLGNEFLGSIFSCEPYAGDIDIEVITEYPEELYERISQLLQAFIAVSKKSFLWSIRFSHPQGVYGNIANPLRSCIYRRVFNCSSTVCICGDIEIDHIKSLCKQYANPLDQKYFSGKALLETRVLEMFSNSNLVFVPYGVYSSLAPLFFDEWRPMGSKVQAGSVLKLRLPERPHSTTIMKIEDICELQEKTRSALVISL